MALIQRLKAFLSDVSENRTEDTIKSNDAILEPLERELKPLPAEPP